MATATRERAGERGERVEFLSKEGGAMFVEARAVGEGQAWFCFLRHHGKCEVAVATGQGPQGILLESVGSDGLLDDEGFAAYIDPITHVEVERNGQAVANGRAWVGFLSQDEVMMVAEMAA
jgi:hypothetical protein